MIELGRLTIAVEWSGRWHWLPFAECIVERDPYVQIWYDYVWHGSFGWLRCWVQISVSKSRGRFWWQGR